MADPLGYGPRGETLAAEVCRRAGWTVERRNYRVRGGELDLILRKDEVLCFVEVKTRAEGSRDVPNEAVTPQKRRRLLYAALRYMEETDFSGSWRFAVFELYVRDGKPLRYRILDCPMEDLTDGYTP